MALAPWACQLALGTQPVSACQPVLVGPSSSNSLAKVPFPHLQPTTNSPMVCEIIFVFSWVRGGPNPQWLMPFFYAYSWERLCLYCIKHQLFLLFLLWCEFWCCMCWSSRFSALVLRSVFDVRHQLHGLSSCMVLLRGVSSLRTGQTHGQLWAAGHRTWDLQQPIHGKQASCYEVNTMYEGYSLFIALKQWFSIWLEGSLWYFCFNYDKAAWFPTGLLKSPWNQNASFGGGLLVWIC